MLPGIVAATFRNIAVAAALAGASVPLVACSSDGSSSPGATGTVPATVAAAATPPATLAATPTAAAAQGKGVTCPAASVVASATGKSVTGPTGGVTHSVGPESTTVCGYPISGGGPDSQVSITYIGYTVDALRSSAQNLAAQKYTAVSGLGNAAYEGPNGLWIFSGSMQIAINAPGTSGAQLEALGHAIVGP